MCYVIFCNYLDAIALIVFNISVKGDIGSCLGWHFLDGQENLKLLPMAEGGISQSKWPKVVSGIEITLPTSFLHDVRHFFTFFFNI